MTVHFLDLLTVEDYGVLSVGDVHLGPQATLNLRGRGMMSVAGTLTSETQLILNGNGTLQLERPFAPTQPVSLSGGATVIVDRIEAPSLSLANGSVLTTLASTATQMHAMELEISGALSVDVTSRIDVSGKGYVQGRTIGNTTVGGATNGGGSYGGRGGGPGANATYGDQFDPDDWGSGGGGTGGGAGGGLVRITAGGFAIDGKLLARASGYSSTGGSGGGIFVSAGRLSGSGEIDASGGGSGFGGVTGPGGGGGRVAVYAPDLVGFNRARIPALGGNGSGFHPGGSAGTIHVVRGEPRTHVRSHSPAGINDGYLAAPLQQVILTFNRAIDAATFTPVDVIIEGRGRGFSPTAVVPVTDRSFRLDFPQLSEAALTPSPF
jgi:hypothetical protein